MPPKTCINLQKLAKSSWRILSALKNRQIPYICEVVYLYDVRSYYFI